MENSAHSYTEGSEESIQEMDNKFIEASKKIIRNAKSFKMKDNTEGSEPIKLTDEQRRIEKEANKFASFETAPTEFEKYHDLYTGYIAGANAERERKRALTKEQLTKIFHEQVDSIRKEERNKAIDLCISEIERLNDDGVLYESTARKALESLKSDSK